MAKRAPIEIRSMFVSMVPPYGGRRGSVYDVAILTPSDKYVEYEFVFQHDRLSNLAIDTIKALMAGYRLTAESSVCMTDSIPARNPLAQYVGILAQQIGFRTWRVGVKKISDRLCRGVNAIRRRAGKDRRALEKAHLEAIWRYLVESGRCGWVTPAYAEYVARLGDQQRRRKKLLRIGAYYMRMRRLWSSYDKRRRTRAAER